jgi:hypothetical protein
MKISERKLRNLIREELLAEARMTPASAERKGIRFQVMKLDNLVKITAIAGDEEDDVVGTLKAAKPDLHCLGAWEIRGAKVSSTFDGLGPLLYDLMLDLVSPDPLTSDRGSVSLAAKNVWDYYMSKRPDIESEKLDNQYDERTPGYEEDNCDYASALMWSKEGQPWHSLSINRAYRRKDGGTPTLDALDDLIEFV